MKRFNFIITPIVLLAFYAMAWADTVSVRPYGISTPKWYSYSAGEKSDYYLEHPTLSANDQVVTEDATQTLTSKTLTSPTINTGVSGTAILDDDTMATATDETLATAESIKAYVDSGTVTLTNKTLTSPTITGPVISNFLLPAEDTTETNILTAAESGKVIWLNSATEFVTTLPALSTVSAGTNFKFVVKAAPASADYTVITGDSLENKIYGLVVVNGASVPGADEDTITFADGAAAVGDWVEVVSDGTSWYVSGQGGAAGAITLTQAD